MRDLETSLRVSLFQRKGKRILLIPNGQIFSKHHRAILQQVEHVLQEITTTEPALRAPLHRSVCPHRAQEPFAGRAAASSTCAELHQERILQLPDTFVMRRMSDAICHEHQVRPDVAEINAIALHGAAQLTAIRLKGKNLALEIRLLRLIDSRAKNAVSDFATLAREFVPKIIKSGVPESWRVVRQSLGSAHVPCAGCAVPARLTFLETKAS